jgi:hypothetical protein
MEASAEGLEAAPVEDPVVPVSVEEVLAARAEVVPEEAAVEVVAVVDAEVVEAGAAIKIGAVPTMANLPASETGGASNLPIPARYSSPSRTPRSMRRPFL